MENRISFEQFDKAAQKTFEENRKKFSVDNMEIIRGEAPQALEELPDPDAVFIGGHGGYLKEIMAKVLSVLGPDGVIVFNSVTSPKVPTNSRQLWDEACEELGIQQEEPLRIQLNDYNPIEILKAHR